VSQLAGHRYLTRGEWGARAPVQPLVRMAMPSPRLWIHHSATEQHGSAGVRDIQRYHQRPKAEGGKGWKDIAYNFLIDNGGVEDGTIFEGRGAGIIGGATEGDNSTSHAICLLGNFENHGLTAAAWSALVDLTRHGRNAGWWVPTCGGHRNAPGAQTECPGDHLYSRLGELRKAITSSTTPTSAPTPIFEEDDSMFLYSAPGEPVFFCDGGVSVGINEASDMATFDQQKVKHFRLDADTFAKFRARYPGA
jgi:hypothetical protein